MSMNFSGYLSRIQTVRVDFATSASRTMTLSFFPHSSSSAFP